MAYAVSFVNPTITPGFVFQPITGRTAGLQVFNQGTSTVYVGRSGVTPANGVPVAPGTQLMMQGVSQAIYACVGTTNASAATTVAGAATAGTTGFTLAAGATLYTGATVQLGSGVTSENLQVSTVGFTSGPGTIVTSTPSMYAHNSGQVAQVVNAFPPGILRVNPGQT